MNSIKDFYKGWPDKGLYIASLQKVCYHLHHYLMNFPNKYLMYLYPNYKNKKFAVIFDIDDTLVYTDPEKLHEDIKLKSKYMIFPENKYISYIAKLCKYLGYYIIIITARPYDSEPSSIENLKMFNIDYDELIHNKEYPNSTFKVSLKQDLSKKYNIILSIGDSWNDILGLDNCLCIKLPDTNDINTYFTYNNKEYYIL